MDFVLVAVGEEWVEPAVGAFQFADLFGGQQCREAFLPAILSAFDFAFGLRGRGIAEGRPAAVEGGAQLSEGIGGVKKKAWSSTQSAKGRPWAGKVRERKSRWAGRFSLS